MDQILMQRRFIIRPEPGVWVFDILDGNGTEITVNNNTVPNTYVRGISQWTRKDQDTLNINWYLCDWQVTFSNPLYMGIPTHQQLIEFFFGPTRIPIA